MRALVLGATGHVGCAIARELCSRGWDVSTVSRRPDPPANLAGLAIDFRTGDLDGLETFDEWVRGHSLVVDAAAPYHFRLRSASCRDDALRAADARMHALVSSVARAGATLVYVSSFTTLSRERSLLKYARRRALRALHPYFELKERMEHRVQSAARDGLTTVVVNPTVCLGPWDIKPSQDCLIPVVLRREMPATTSHSVNVIDVRDVASATVNAVEQGLFGTPIPLWGHNTTMQGLITTIARLGGVPAPTLRVSANLSAVAAYAGESLTGLETSRGLPPSLGFLLSLEQSWHPPSREQRLLGVSPRPLSRTLVEAMDWFRSIGHLHRPESHAQGWS